MLDPTKFTLDVDKLSLFKGTHIIVVDDILTTGDTVEAMLESLAKIGMRTTSVAVLGARFGGKPLMVETARDLASEISSRLDIDYESVYNKIVEAHGMGYDNLIAKAIHEAKSKPKTEKIYGLITRKAESLRGDMEAGTSSP